MNKEDNNIFLETAIFAAKSAASVINSSYNTSVKTYKALTDLVTQTDIDSEKKIIELISSKFPDHSFLAEESGKKLNSSNFTWIIDPLDGTTNFVHGYPCYGVSLALMHENETIVGVVVELPMNNIYFATNTSSAYCNDDIIQVSKNTNLINSLLVTGFGYDHGDKWNLNMELFKKFTDLTQGVRRSGAAAIDLCHTASGKVDGYWEFDVKPWDLAAGALIATRAGAKLTNLKGKKFSIFENEVLVSNGLIHSEMVNTIHDIS